MARKLPNTGRQENIIQPQIQSQPPVQTAPQQSKSKSKETKQKPLKQPKEKGRGFFSKIFGGGNVKKNKQPPQSQQMGQQFNSERKENIQPQPQYLNELSQSNQRNNSSQSQQKSRYEQFNSKFQQPIINDAQAKQIYGEQTMEQKVFLYIEPGYQQSILKQFSVYKGLTPLLAGDVYTLSQTYRKNNIADDIILFTLNQSEVDPIKKFLIDINITGFNAEIINVLIVRDRDVNIESIIGIPNISKFCRITKVDKITGLSVGYFQKVLAQVVIKQPQYPTLNAHKIPESATILVDKQTFRVDRNRLKSALQKAKENCDSEVVSEQIKRRI